MTQEEIDIRFMRRALQLAANGRGYTSPNPMVGAVIVAPDGRIIGEGWHRHFGGPHAEVNAVASVADTDRHLLPESTIYVTLEPCSHYGKTPPCAKLLVETRIGRVVVGAGDPNPKVSGRGISMILEAGIPVTEHVLENECRETNKAFMTAHTLHRPFVTLKWARSADGFMDAVRAPGEPAVKFSTPITSQTVHWRRANHDAIAVGATTAIADNPRLDVRLIEGRSPRPVIFDHHGIVNADNCDLMKRSDTIHLTADEPLAEQLHRLYADYGITSLLVEGGANLLRKFIFAGIWDEAFEEVSPLVLGENGTTKAPEIENKYLSSSTSIVNFYSHKVGKGVKNI